MGDRAEDRKSPDVSVTESDAIPKNGLMGGRSCRCNNERPNHDSIFALLLMQPVMFSAYRHSGKFGVHGPLLTLLAAGAAGFPLALVYAYVTTWLPFVYVNFLITVGYGALIGGIGAVILKVWVRNNLVAAVGALVSGLLVLYLIWSAHGMSPTRAHPFFPGRTPSLRRWANSTRAAPGP